MTAAVVAFGGGAGHCRVSVIVRVESTVECRLGHFGRAQWSSLSWKCFNGRDALRRKLKRRGAQPDRFGRIRVRGGELLRRTLLRINVFSVSFFFFVYGI